MTLNKLKQLVGIARNTGEDAQVRAGLALLRLTLQYASLPLVEWVLEHGDVAARPADAEALRKPSDGTIAEHLEAALVAAENSGWFGIRGDFWIRRKSEASRHFLKRAAASPAEILAAFVAARNDSLEGHGLPGADDSGAAMLALVELLLESIPECFPAQDARGLFLQSPDGRRCNLTLLKVIEGDLVCYRKSRRTLPGVCKIEAQRQTGLFERAEVHWEAQDRLANKRPSDLAGAYEYVPTQTEGWTPLVHIPDRLTETFTGRSNEIKQLLDWFDDTGSRACLVWGEGGMGKTTLVVEFIHQVLNGARRADSAWRPALISYYSAKRTRWGTTGLQKIQFGKAGLADGVAEIVRSLEGTRSLEKAWIEKRGVDLAKLLGDYLLKTWGVKPRDHLIILDNTETLTSSEEDAKLLGREIGNLCRYCGRVVVTSRRSEKIEAAPVEVDRLTVDEGIKLLHARATVLHIKQLRDAKPKDLRRYVEDLEPRPLLLEVFAQTMTEEALSADKALSRVKAMKQRDLGEFLYADVWSRFSPPVQHLLLLMVRIADNHDDALLRLAAEAVGVSVMSAMHALEESRGIAKVTRTRGDTHISFRRGFLEFCAHRTVMIDQVRYPEAATISKVKYRYEQYLVTKDAEVVDRVAKAFRKPFAKMARAAVQQGRLDECQDLYELAVSDDPQNGLLFDRYAFFLLRHLRLPEEALGKSNRAAELSPDEPEVWFTRGMIQGQLQHTTESLVSLEKAQALGKPTHLVKVQMAYALLRAVIPPLALAREAVREARKATPTHSADAPRLFERHLRELKGLEYRLGITGKA